MVPTWLLTLLVLVGSCIGALYLGSNLSQMDPWMAGELIIFAVACTICAVSNNFPLLLAIGSWTPFFPHLGGPSSLPAIVWFLAWMGCVLFLRLCVKGYLNYIQSFDWICLLCFVWVPIRFMMNPIFKLGGTAGGTGVSGLVPYFNYFMAAVLMIITGAILTNRAKLVSYLRWSFVVILISGVLLTTCAFIPATAPYLVAMGSFAAGNIGDGVQRLVQLPGYGLELAIMALCPTLFKLKPWQSAMVFTLGCAMMVVGGNRSAIASVIVSIPIVLLVQRRAHALSLSLFLMVFGLCTLRAVTSTLDESEIPPMMRAFGVFDSKIAEATGGSASATWRYSVWADGMKKILETPLAGKGFGNVTTQQMDTKPGEVSTDYAALLAGGEAHNGFIDCAYGLGIPFALALSVFMFIYFFKEVGVGLSTDKHDPELREIHAYLAGVIGYYPVCVYSAFDLSVGGLWQAIALSCLVSHLPRSGKLPKTESDAYASAARYGRDPAVAKPQAYRRY